jgi:hypothetical protein
MTDERQVYYFSFHHPWRFFPPEGGVGQTQAWMPTYVIILRIPQMI